MAAILRVVPTPIYKVWKNDPGFEEGITPLVEVGEIIWKAKGCNACHSVDGSANTGPTWVNNYGYEIPLADGTSIPADDTLEWENYTRESILYPAARIHAGYANQMPSYNGRITDFELNGVIAYMKSLSDRAPVSPLDEPIEGEADAGTDETETDQPESGAMQPQEDL
jgi:cytochrome c oxidase subunit 2